MRLADLTPREREVAELVADGLTDKAIAFRLGISDHTVGRHLEHIALKIGMDKERTRRERIKRWYQHAA